MIAAGVSVCAGCVGHGRKVVLVVYKTELKSMSWICSAQISMVSGPACVLTHVGARRMRTRLSCPGHVACSQHVSAS